MNTTRRTFENRKTSNFRISNLAKDPMCLASKKSEVGLLLVEVTFVKKNTSSARSGIAVDVVLTTHKCHTCHILKEDLWAIVAEAKIIKQKTMPWTHGKPQHTQVVQQSTKPEHPTVSEGDLFILGIRNWCKLE